MFRKASELEGAELWSAVSQIRICAVKSHQQRVRVIKLLQTRRHDAPAFALWRFASDAACRYVREEGDMAVMEWVQKEAQGILPAGDYEVTAILDARKQGRTTEYIVKWKASCFPFIHRLHGTSHLCHHIHQQLLDFPDPFSRY